MQGRKKSRNRQYRKSGEHMIFGPMNEMEMKQYLQEMQVLETKIYERKKEAYEKVETLEECIERNSFPPTVREYSSSGIGKTDRTYDILEKSYMDIKRQMDDVSQELLQINEEEEKMYFVKKCIRELPMLQADIITELGIKGCSWEVFARNNYMSKATVSRKRRRAMEHLLMLYNDHFVKQGKKD